MHFTGLAFSDNHTKNRAEKINVGINYKTKALRDRWAQVYMSGMMGGERGVWMFAKKIIFSSSVWHGKVCPQRFVLQQPIQLNGFCQHLTEIWYRIRMCKIKVKTKKKNQHRWSDSENPWSRQVTLKVSTCQVGCGELAPQSSFCFHCCLMNYECMCTG